MIDKLYIMYEHGAAVFEKIYFTRLNAMTDPQLLAGFTSALSSFASEAFGSGLQSIYLQTGEKLAIMRHGPSGIIGICIADGRDHESLLSSLLEKILDRFYEKYKKEIDVKDPSLIGKAEKFDKEVDAILKNKTSDRTNWKMYLGIILGFIILGILTSFAINRRTLNIVPGPVFFMFIFLGESMGSIMGVLMMFIALIFFIPSFVAGYLSGNRNRALISGIIIIFGSYLFLFLGSQFLINRFGLDLRGWVISFSPLIFFLTLSVAYCAGYIVERLRLYSFPQEEGEENFLEKIFRKIKEKIGL